MFTKITKIVLCSVLISALSFGIGYLGGWLVLKEYYNEDANR